MTALIEPGRLAVVASDPVADALREWARRVIGASVGWGPEHGRPHLEELSELERQVLTLVHDAAATLSLLRQGLADDRDREWLERLVKVARLAGKQDRGGVAVRIVTECAEQRAPGLAGVTDPKAWARFCKAMLVTEADPAFELLPERDDGTLPEVEQLLASYTPGTATRPPRGKRTPRKIVAMLYELIGDETVTEDAISKSDQRKTAKQKKARKRKRRK